jgi:hypothetical protein
MQIHSQPVNLNAITLHSPLAVAAQQAAEVRSRPVRAALKLNEESDPFERFAVGQEPGEVPRRQQRRDHSTGVKTLHTEKKEPSGRILST